MFQDSYRFFSGDHHHPKAGRTGFVDQHLSVASHVGWRKTVVADQHRIALGLTPSSRNLEPFKARHGKLIMYHGLAEGNVPAEDAIEYYEKVGRAMGGLARTMDFARLFLAPGMGHCSGGVGPDAFDAVGALDQWVEQGNAPKQIVASHISNAVTDRTRPLCPYPAVAKWNGSGSSDEAVNFTCVTAPDRHH